MRQRRLGYASALVPAFSVAVACFDASGFALEGTWEDASSGETLIFRNHTLLMGELEVPYKVVDAEPRQIYIKVEDNWVGFATVKVSATKLTLCMATIYEHLIGPFPVGVSRTELPDGLTGDCSTLSRVWF